jgi:RNA polymerase sigma-70 factor (ECF subfamily)
VIRRGNEVVDVAAWVWRSAFAIAGGMLAARAKAGPAGLEATETAEFDSSMIEFVGLLGALNRQQRACVVLRYVTQLDNAGIAAALGMREGTVRVQLHRAHAALRRTLKEADHGR